MKNKFIDRNILIKLIPRFRLLGIIFIGVDIVSILVSVIPSISNLNAVLFFFTRFSGTEIIIGIIFLSLAEIIYLGTKIKEENDLTV